MPSPFPGMDPWLESGAVWPGFHEKLIVKTVEVMQPELRTRGYYVDIGERIWLADAGRGILPDDVILHAGVRSADSANGRGLLTVKEPVRVTKSRVEVRESYIEIYDAQRHQVVTGIEYLSPTNKRNKEGRKLYRRKQRDLRASNVNLVEIDFLRRGPHMLDVPLDVVEALRPWHFLVNLVRRDCDEHQFYPIKLQEPLPPIRIPLRSGDVDAQLDLQDVFNRSYDIGPYPVRLDYTAPPPPPELCPADAAWADDILKSKGLRKTA